MSPEMMATTEEAVEAEEVKTDMDMTVDTTVAADKNAVPMESIIASPTATARIPRWTTRYVPTDTR